MLFNTGFYFASFLERFSGGFRPQNGANLHRNSSFRGVAKNTGQEPPAGAVFDVCLGVCPKRQNLKKLILVEAKLRFLLFPRLRVELPKASKPASKFKAHALAK